MNRKSQIALVLAFTVSLVADANAEGSRSQRRRFSQLTFDKEISKEAKKEASRIKEASKEQNGYTHQFIQDRRNARGMLKKERLPDAYSVQDLKRNKAPVAAAPAPVVQRPAVQRIVEPAEIRVSSERYPTLIYNQTQYLQHLPGILNTDTPKEAVQPWEVMRSVKSTEKQVVRTTTITSTPAPAADAVAPKLPTRPLR